jgi:hypothetical protein
MLHIDAVIEHDIQCLVLLHSKDDVVADSASAPEKMFRTASEFERIFSALSTRRQFRIKLCFPNSQFCFEKRRTGNDVLKIVN